MSVEVRVQKKNSDGKWTGIPLSDTQDMTLEVIATLYDGQEVVVEYRTGDKRGYFCGTEKWRDHFKGKGHQSLTFPEMLQQLRAKGSALLGREMPTAMAERVFSGAELAQATLF